MDSFKSLSSALAANFIFTVLTPYFPWEPNKWNVVPTELIFPIRGNSVGEVGLAYAMNFLNGWFKYVYLKTWPWALVWGRKETLFSNISFEAHEAKDSKCYTKCLFNPQKMTHHLFSSISLGNSMYTLKECWEKKAVLPHTGTNPGRQGSSLALKLLNATEINRVILICSNGRQR